MKSKFNNSKRGFTIVELVIVIAIIAILAAVLIPTFSSLVQSAQMASDTSLITNLNKELAMAEAKDGKNATMSDVIKDLENAGYSLALLTPTAEGCYIAWDADTDRVVYMDSEFKILYPKENKGETLANAWQIAHNKEQLDKYAASGKTFNVYLASGFDATELEVSYGIDVGDNTNITKLIYKNTSTDKKTVVIRTNGGEFEVNAPSGTIYHYGTADNVNIIAVDTASYHECGTIFGNIEVAAGHVIVESGAKVNGITITATEITKNSDNKYNVSVDVDDNADVSYVTSKDNLYFNDAIKIPESTKTIDKRGQGENHIAYNLTTGKYITGFPSATMQKEYSHFVLVKDVDLKSTVTMYNSFTLDLNGHNIIKSNANNKSVFIINSSSRYTKTSGDLKYSITGKGSIITTYTGSDASSVIDISNSANGKTINVFIDKDVTLNGLTGISLMSTKIDSYKNINIDFAGKIVNENNTSVSTKYSQGIYINGLYQEVNNCPNIIIRETASIEQGNGVAVYAAGYANWTIYGGSFKGAEGLEFKSGNVNIIGGTFEATKSKEHTVNNSGPSCWGYALAVVENTNYAKALTVNVHGGNFKSDVAVLQDQENAANKANLTITGGTFVNDVSAYKK